MFLIPSNSTKTVNTNLCMHFDYLRFVFWGYITKRGNSWVTDKKPKVCTCGSSIPSQQKRPHGEMSGYNTVKSCATPFGLKY